MGSWHGLCPGAWIYAIASRCILKEILSTNIVSNWKKVVLWLNYLLALNYLMYNEHNSVEILTNIDKIALQDKFCDIFSLTTNFSKILELTKIVCE